ncbi:hypothetical protein NN561_008327 [Cricetulus griseus]
MLRMPSVPGCFAFARLCLLSPGKGILEDELRWAGSGRTLGVPRAFGYAKEEGVIGLDSSTSLPPAMVKSQGAQRPSLHWRDANKKRMSGEEKNYNSQHAVRSVAPGEAGCALELALSPESGPTAAG